MNGTWSEDYPTVPGWYWVAIPEGRDGINWSRMCVELVESARDQHWNPSGLLAFRHQYGDCEHWSWEMEEGSRFQRIPDAALPALPTEPPPDESLRETFGELPSELPEKSA